MSLSIAIREAGVSDAERISALVSDLSREFILPDVAPDARSRFLSALDSAAIAEFMRGPFRYHVLEIGGELVGVVGVRDNRHLYHLFVAKNFQGRGLGRRLWEHAAAACLAQGNPGEFTVNASTNAVPVYEKLGFVATAPIQQRDGISYAPMKLTRTADR
ncbi:MAG TPA: GNAT family N-acetyltransferase [Candidatus Manganitrophaceae bacterium]